MCEPAQSGGTVGQLARVSLRAWEAERIFNKMGARCRFCGLDHYDISPRTGRIAHAEIEHLIPVSRGGTNDRWNLTIGCRSCNRRKGTQTAVEFGFSVIESAAGVVRYARHA